MISISEEEAVTPCVDAFRVESDMLLARATNARAVFDRYDGAMDRTLVTSLFLRLCLRIVVRITFVFS